MLFSHRAVADNSDFYMLLIDHGRLCERGESSFALVDLDGGEGQD